MSTERIVVVRVQLEPLPRYAERARHPARHEPQDAVALVQSGLDLLPVSSHVLDLATCGIRPRPAAPRGLSDRTGAADKRRLPLPVWGLALVGYSGGGKTSASCGGTSWPSSHSSSSTL